MVWAKKWSPSKIEANRIKDRNAKAQYYDRFRQVIARPEKEKAIDEEDIAMLNGGWFRPGFLVGDSAMKEERFGH